MNYIISEEEYNDLMHQLVTSDNLVATDKAEYLENKELFWQTDNSKQIEMLDVKKPVQVLDRSKVEAELNGGKTHKDIHNILEEFQNWLTDRDDNIGIEDIHGAYDAIADIVNKLICQLIPQQKSTEGKVIAEGKAENILNDAGSEFFYIGDYELDTIYETLELAIRKNEGKKVKLILKIDK